MTSIQSVVGTLPGYVVYFAAALLTAVLLAILLAYTRTKQAGYRSLIALIQFLISVFLLSVLLNYSYNALIEGISGFLYGFEERLLSLPWLLYVGAEFVTAATVCLHVRALRRYRDTHLGSDAIRRTVDLLPTALMVSDADGTVLLANLKMTALCRKLTGKTLSDAHRFMDCAESASDGERLVHTPDGETWQFTRSRISLDGREYDQLTAVERTEKYRITQELKDKNEHLREVQYRMRSLAARERSLVAAREVMNARMTVHNRMGGVLLSGKYYLDHPEDVKEEELLRLLEYNNYFLLGEVEQPRKEGDPLEESIRMARRIGVTVKLRGEVPKAEPARGLIAQAVDQCAANAVRHAGGDLLSVLIAQSETALTASFTNNGSAPKGPIAETGGLATLRKAVEGSGGTMAVQSAPVFLLRISIPIQS